MRSCRTANASWPFCDDDDASRGGGGTPPPFWLASKLTKDSYDHALENHPSRARDARAAVVHVHAVRTDGELARFGKLPNRTADRPYLLFFNGINCDYEARRPGSKAPRAPRARRPHALPRSPRAGRRAREPGHGRPQGARRRPGAALPGRDEPRRG